MEAIRIKSTERVRSRALKSSHKIYDVRVFQKSKSQVRVRLQVFEKRFFFKNLINELKSISTQVSKIETLEFQSQNRKYSQTSQV